MSPRKRFKAVLSAGMVKLESLAVFCAMGVMPDSQDFVAEEVDGQA